MVSGTNSSRPPGEGPDTDSDALGNADHDQAADKASIPKGLGEKRVEASYGHFVAGIGRAGDPLGTETYRYGRDRSVLEALPPEEWLKLCDLFLNQVSLEVFHRLQTGPVRGDSLKPVQVLAGLCEELGLCAEHRTIDSTALRELWRGLQLCELGFEEKRFREVRTLVSGASLIVLRLRDRISGERSGARASTSQATDDARTNDALVTLDEAAALCKRSKRTLDRYKTKGKLPPPDFRGGGGRANRWHWSNLRPPLEAITGMKLPARFPSGRVI